jgi:hypothetical protein
MRHGHYRTQSTLVRSPDPLPRWIKQTALWSAVAVAALILSRALTVAAIDEQGPPPMVMAQVGAPFVQ